MLEIASHAAGTIFTWQFWVIAIASGLIIIAGNLILTGVMSYIPAGGWVSVPLMFLLPSLVITAGIALLLPTILFRLPDLNPAFLTKGGLPGYLWAALAAFVGSVIVAFIPILGRTATALALVSAIVVTSVLIGQFEGPRLRLVPDPWTIIVMLVCIALAGLVVTYALSFVAIMLAGGSEDRATVLLLPLNTLFSYFVASIYGAWVAVENFGASA